MKIKNQNPILRFFQRISLAIKDFMGRSSRSYFRRKINEEYRKDFYK